MNKYVAEAIGTFALVFLGCGAAVIGGMGTIEGPIIGILVFFALQTLFADFGPGYLLALGLIGIAVMLFAPRGLWGLFSVRTGVQLFPIRRRLQSHPDNHK